ncbi:MAG TPA: hypothetical protein VG860_08515 [Terriglobia bacterium]|jgi:hypothetical protein|nr:hypothetical protein [Terriglobia bacterium]
MLGVSTDHGGWQAYVSGESSARNCLFVSLAGGGKYVPGRGTCGIAYEEYCSGEARSLDL